MQLAVASGCRVIAVAGARGGHRVAELGAEKVLDYRDPSMGQKPAELIGNRASVIWYCSGSFLLTEQARLLGTGGRIVHTAGIDTGALCRRDTSIHGFAISNASVDELCEVADGLTTMFAGEGIATRIGVLLPLSATAEAHRMPESANRHRIGGKIVLLPDPVREVTG